MAEYPALPLFTDAYMSDTRHLTTLQHGAYLLMLMTAWRMPDCSLPNDDVFLSRICGLDKRTWKANKEAILYFWKLNDEQKWYQGRLKDERNYVEQLRNKNVLAGKSSALKRKKRHSTSVQPKVNQTSTPTPTPTPIEDTNVSSYKVTFGEFWTAYPTLNRSKGSKKKAEAAYEVALKKTNHETIMKGLHAYATYLRNANQSNADAFRWLQDERWGDDYRFNTGTTGISRKDPASTAYDKAKSIIARRNAAAGVSGRAESANLAASTNLRLPENIR